MAIDIENFYIRIGKLAVAAINANTYRTTTLAADVTAIAAEYTGDIDLIGDLGSQQTYQESAVGSFNTYLKSLAQSTLYNMVDDDRPLTNRSLGAYLTELDRQQIAASTELDDSPATIGAITVTGTADSSGRRTKIVLTGKDVKGVASDVVYPEVVRFDIAATSQQGTTAFSEILSIAGEAVEQDKLGLNWPGGSGTSFTMAVVDPSIDDIITNCSFTEYTVTNTPDDWTIGAGAVTTNFVNFAAGPRTGDTACLKVIGTGVDVGLYQVIDLEPNTRYLFTAKIYRDASTNASNFIFRLADGSGTTITDDASTGNTVTQDVNALTDDTWNTITAVFITPSVLPSEVRLDFASASLHAATRAYLSHLCITPMVSMYNGGPAVAAVSGMDEATINDRYTSTITVSGTDTSMVRWMERFFDCSLYGVRIRTGGTATTDYDDTSLIGQYL